MSQPLPPPIAVDPHIRDVTAKSDPFHMGQEYRADPHGRGGGGLSIGSGAVEGPNIDVSDALAATTGKSGPKGNLAGQLNDTAKDYVNSQQEEQPAPIQSDADPPSQGVYHDPSGNAYHVNWETGAASHLGIAP